MALNKAIKEFICENCNEIQWSGSEDGSGAEAYFASVTSPEQLTDFALGSSAAAGGSSGAKKPVAAGANSAQADALSAAMQGPSAALKTAASAVGNDSLTRACGWFLDALND